MSPGQWEGKIVKCDLTGYVKYNDSDPNTLRADTSYIESKAAHHIELHTRKGLIVEFWKPVEYRPIEGEKFTLNTVCEPIMPTFKVGDRATVFGEIKKNYGYKIIIECLNFLHHPTKPAE